MSANAKDTIFALSSGRGRSGVAVLRVSGPLSVEAGEALSGSLPPARQMALRILRDPGTGAILDRALVLFFAGPASFTGEDCVEFHVHGGSAVVDGVIDALAALPGLRPAMPGDFTRRAFENGRLDLTEVEGLADLIDAETSAQRRQALRQSRGALGELYGLWRNDLIEALAFVEASLDFSDEADVPAAVEGQAVPKVERLAGEITKHLNDDRRGERLRDGFVVVLVGAPNAGKSSLINVLAKRDVAIVAEEAGTTRDVIEVNLDLDGLPVTILDTAGIREAEGAIEREGVRRALDRAASADLVLWLVDAEQPQWMPPEGMEQKGCAVMTVLNKCDRAVPMPPAGVDLPGRLFEISVKSGAGLSALTDAMSQIIAEGFDVSEAPAITRARHRQELEKALDALNRFLKGDLGELELRGEDLRAATHALGRITGRVDVEDVLDRIFEGFCIGK